MDNTKTLQDALDRASRDPSFAASFVEDPTKFQEEYQLTDEQLDLIAGAGAGASGAGAAGDYEAWLHGDDDDDEC